MAQSIAIVSGSPFIGSPICVSVKADVVGSNCSFHNVNLQVRAALSTDGVYETFLLSSPSDNGEEVTFDVSPCLRSLSRKYTYQPGAQQVPHLRFRLSAYDSYMQDGIYREESNWVNYGQELNGLFGSFSERERLAMNGFASIGKFTRKPASGEVFGTKLGYIYAKDKEDDVSLSSERASGQLCEYYINPSISCSRNIEGRDVYFDAEKNNLIYFLFVNSRGAVESVCAETLESIHSTGQSEIDVKSYTPGFSISDGLSARKSARRMEIGCSTGAIDKEWMNWWLDEFLGGDKFRNSISESCWVHIDGQWVPCVAYIDDDAEVYDRSGNRVNHIEFTVRLSVTGHV